MWLCPLLKKYLLKEHLLRKKHPLQAAKVPPPEEASRRVPPSEEASPTACKSTSF